MRVGRSSELPRTPGPACPENRDKENLFFVKFGKKFDTSGSCHFGIDTRIS